MRIFITILAAFVLAIFASGCFDYGEIIELNTDGSGTLSQHLVFYKNGIEGLMEMMSAMSADSVTDSNKISIMSRAEIEKKLAESKTDIKLLSFTESENDSTVAYDVKYSFKNLNEILAFTKNMDKTESVGALNSTAEVSFVKDESGSWVFTREIGDSPVSGMGALENESEAPSGEASTESGTEPAVDPMAGDISPKDPATESAGSDSAKLEGENPGAEMQKAMESMMNMMFAGKKVTLKVKFPGKIVESNATSTTGNEATWDYKLTDLTKAAGSMRAVIKP